MDKFYCQKCQKTFEARGEKREWQSSLYGVCWKKVAKCPFCGSEAEEIKKITKSKVACCECSNSCGVCRK